MDPYAYMRTTEPPLNDGEEEEEEEEKMHPSTRPQLHSASFSTGHPLNTWYEFRTEQGRSFYHNPVTKTSIWTHPLELFKRERAVQLKKIPRTSWKLAYCRDGRTFFYHPIRKIRTWKLPEELQEHEIISGELEEDDNNNDIPEDVNEDDKFDDGVQEVDTDHHEGIDDHNNNGREIIGSEGNQLKKVQVTIDTRKSEERLCGSLLGVSPMDRSREFRNMLEELKINPFSSWDIEESKLNKDPRFECK